MRESVADEAFVAHLVSITENITDMLRAMNEKLPIDDQLYELKSFMKNGINLLIIGSEYT